MLSQIVFRISISFLIEDEKCKTEKIEFLQKFRFYTQNLSNSFQCWIWSSKKSSLDKKFQKFYMSISKRTYYL